MAILHQCLAGSRLWYVSNIEEDTINLIVHPRSLLDSVRTVHGFDLAKPISYLVALVKGAYSPLYTLIEALIRTNKVYFVSMLAILVLTTTFMGT